MPTKTKTKPAEFTLVARDDKDGVMAALGETPEGRNRRHIQTMSAETLLAQGIEKGISVEAMERLLAMRRELKAEYAQEAYNRAMAAFQSECPTIKKTKEVKTRSGVVAYRYAPIESILEQVKPYLKEHGFSYSTTMELGDGTVKVVCRVTHAAGHSEESPMHVPYGNKTDIMSNSQVTAAASTFAKRYAFCNAFGILTGDEDTDAQEPPQKSPVATQGKQGATKPARPAVSTRKPQKSDKERIAEHLQYLGIDWKNADVSKAAIRSITQLEPEEGNFPEIEGRLSVKVQEQREAKAEAERLNKLNAAPVK